MPLRITETYFDMLGHTLRISLWQTMQSTSTSATSATSATLKNVWNMWNSQSLCLFFVPPGGCPCQDPWHPVQGGAKVMITFEMKKDIEKSWKMIRHIKYTKIYQNIYRIERHKMVPSGLWQGFSRNDLYHLLLPYITNILQHRHGQSGLTKLSGVRSAEIKVWTPSVDAHNLKGQGGVGIGRKEWWNLRR